MYAITHTDAATLLVTCTDCGHAVDVADAEAAAAFIDEHEAEHCTRPDAILAPVSGTPAPAASTPTVTNDELWRWIDEAPADEVREPSADERSGAVQIPLGFVAIAEARVRAAAHACGTPDVSTVLTAQPRQYLRLEDERLRQSEHPVRPEENIGCLIEELRRDDRITTAWFVTPTLGESA